MHLTLSLYFFLAATSVEALSFVPRATVGDVWGGVNITEMVLQVSGAISSPKCNATQPCVNLTTIEIPMCLKVLGNPGCWCANADPIHYCAICMSNPTDRTTTPDQTQAATAGHQNYHIGCNAYQAFLNGTSASSMVSSSTSSITSSSSSSSAPTIPTIPVQAAANSGSTSVSAGVVGGIVVGGLIGLGLIGAAVFLVYRYMQNKHQRILESTQRETILSVAQSDAKPSYSTSDNLPVTGYTPPPPNPNPNPNLNTQRESASYNTRMLSLPRV